ncbi:glycosyltransferase family 8 protein [Pantoea sp. BAV 3049]|uniref:glycosyltransferase family 8 protein n=1 Tax=Pantoea sp. BAV 3049 TaxID=2654188 RepID=UPI00131CD851|nr:glycosyltransferase [Pantoea sp. BAV 3049]
MNEGSFERIIDEAFLDRNVHSHVLKAATGGNASESEIRHVVLGVDGGFLRHAFITIQSIMEASPGQIFNFHLITGENTSNVKKNAAILLNGSPHGFTLHKISAELFSDFPTTALFTKATYYRLLAPHFLQGIDTLLYLDADIVCLNNFSTLWNSTKTHNKTAFVALENESIRGELARNVGLITEDYFNAGVMLIDVTRWITEKISLQVFSVLNHRGETLQYLDQDALNIILEEKFGILPKKYNTLFKLGHKPKDYISMPSPDTVFLHYAGADKPWQKWNKQAVCQYYVDIYQRSVWATYPFDGPKNDQQAKKMYKLMFREKKILNGLKWYFAYFKLRYFN